MKGSEQVLRLALFQIGRDVCQPNQLRAHIGETRLIDESSGGGIRQPKRGRQLSNFKRFCGDLDEELVNTGVMKEQSGFLNSDMLNALLFGSGGHIGRVFRIVESAVEHAALRQASRVEPYDVSYAIDNFAIPGGYVARNPMRGGQG